MALWEVPITIDSILEEQGTAMRVRQTNRAYGFNQNSLGLGDATSNFFNSISEFSKF